MIEFDKNFWESIGLLDLSEEQKQEFEAEVMGELQVRVGSEISLGLTDHQIEEFDVIIDGDVRFNTEWLNKNHPDYCNSKIYNRLKSNGYEGKALINELASGFWIKTNKPDYRRIVDEQSEKIHREIISHFRNSDN